MFNGPQIRELMRNSSFDEVLCEAEKRAWVSFKNVSTEFLRKKRNKTMKIWLMPSFQVLSAKMFTKAHFLNYPLDYFPENCGNCSDEEGERFRHGICMMEEQCQGHWDIDFDFFIFILLSRESGRGAMRRTNPDWLRSCLCLQVFRLNFLQTSLICCLPDSTKQR